MAAFESNAAPETNELNPIGSVHPEAGTMSMDGSAPAGFGRRLGAWLIDSAILLLTLLLVAAAMRLLRAIGVWVPAGVGMAPDEIWHGLTVSAKLLVMSTFILSMGPIYYALFEASPWQATLGKRLLKIYVTKDDGKRISIGRAFGRWAAKFVLGWFWLSLASIITIATTKEHKGLHDYIAKTMVLKGRPVPEVRVEPWRIVTAFGLPTVWILGTFLLTV